MFSKIQCVALFLFMISAKAYPMATTGGDQIKIDIQSIVLNLSNSNYSDKTLLIEEVIAIARQHLSQEEMNRLNELLQVLIGRISLGEMIKKKDILKKKLKTAITRYILASKICNSKQSPKKVTLSTTEEELSNLIAKVLKNTDLKQYTQWLDENFSRNHADALGALIVSILREELPLELLEAITQALKVLTKNENVVRLQAEIDTFVTKHSSVLPIS